MSLGKQAKTLSDAQQRAALNHVKSNRYPQRDRVMLLLSFKAGMRAKEIAALTWAMCCDSSSALSKEIALQNIASKGKHGGRTIPMHSDLHAALLELWRNDLDLSTRVVRSERSGVMSATSVANWFWCLFRVLGFSGASSHSGRRTFITRAARKIVEAGGSLRDVQDLAGHASLTTTQRYIQVSDTAKKKVVDLI